MSFPEDGDEDVLHAGVFVFHFTADLLGGIHDGTEIGAHVDLLPGIALHTGQFVHQAGDSVPQRCWVGSDFGENGDHHALRLIEEGRDQVNAAEFRLRLIVRKRLGSLERFL